MTTPTVVITGASTGIGRATALLLDARGYQVLAGVRRDSDGLALQREASPRLRTVRLDVTSPDDVARLVELLPSVAGPAGLAAVINNAGFNYNAAFEFSDDARARALMETNVFGVARVTQALLPFLRRPASRPGGTAKIVIVGSVGSVIGVPWQAWYHASKFAVLGLAHSLRHELYPEQIRVTAILPGGVRTPFLSKSAALIEDAALSLPHDAPTSYVRGLARLRSRVRMADRFGSSPERVAACIARALGRRHPAVRYYVGVDAQILRLLARLAPARLSEGVMRAAFGG